ncbi:MAG: hypothetical protein LR015_10625 [Verrucomicrobia bacterium]|nr:hypothetical protein [Verrucomicrobiota bacterium]
MFRRVFLENWQVTLIVIAFLLTFSAYLMLTLRTILMKKSERDRLANLPLEDDETPKKSTSNKDQKPS